MTRCTSPTRNPAVNCIMFMDDSGQTNDIKDYSKRPDSIIQIGVVIGDPGGQAFIPQAAVP